MANRTAKSIGIITAIVLLFAGMSQGDELLKQKTMKIAYNSANLIYEEYYKKAPDHTCPKRLLK